MKQFLIVGNGNAITYKDFFPYIKNNEIWLGYTLFVGKMPYFQVPLDTDISKGNYYYENGKLFKQVNSICWFTNLDHNKRHRPIDLYKHYSNEYKHYDNYDAIEVGKVCEIPMDYDGVMGVPITFLDKYCPEQFEIVDAREYGLTDRQKNKSTYLIKDADGSIDGKATYVRIAIRHRKAQLMDFNKKFIVVGSTNAITYKEIFPLIKENKLWLGFGFSGGNAYFATPNVCEYAKGVYNAETGLVKFRNCHWFTNLDHNKRHRPLDLYKHYSNEYKHYDNYDAIEVSKVCDIPMDYDGVMGVPITFLDKYCPEQFEILGLMSGAKDDTLLNGNDGRAKWYIDGKATYVRIAIRHRKAQLMEYGKKFLVIGPQNAITNKDTFHLFKENKIWLGMNNVKEFRQPNGEIKKFGNICWYTNIDNAKRNKPLDLYKHYSNEYKHYDNYDAIEVGKVCEIPMDYDGVMGVPITFLDKYNPNQFEIIWQASGNTRASAPTEVLKKLGYIINKEDRGGCGVINGVRQYSRIFIRHRK